MALFTVNYGSTCMNKYMGMNVILPDDEYPVLRDKEGKHAVIYLLHGYTDDYTKWARLSSIERYANELGIAVVMPDGGKSFYTDMVHGDDYFTYITEEVPEYVQKWFPVTTDPEYTYIAGLSMGGYGALKIGLTYPERFRAVGSFSGALGVAEELNARIPDEADDWLMRLNRDLPLVFGENVDITGTKHDVFHLATTLQGKENLPYYYVSCGIEDMLYPANKAFNELATSLNIPLDYSERPGIHEWGFWDEEVRIFMKKVRSMY